MVLGGGEAAVMGVGEEADAGAEGGEGAKGIVGRGVIDDDHLEGGVEMLGKEGVEAGGDVGGAIKGDEGDGEGPWGGHEGAKIREGVKALTGAPIIKIF